MPTSKVQVYVETGVVFEYEVEAPTEEALTAKVREHHHEIATGGYCSNVGQSLTTWPPHRIDKIKSDGPITTNHESEVRKT